MTWTYEGLEAGTGDASIRDQVRFLVQDIKAADPQITDEQITFQLVTHGSDVFRTAVAVARSIAAKYARLVNRTVGTVQADYGRRYRAYLDIVQTLLEMADETSPSSATRVGVSTTGILKTDFVEVVETPFVPPTFTRDLHTVDGSGL